MTLRMLWILGNLQAVSKVLKGSGLVINGEREDNYSPTNSDSPATKGCERKQGSGRGGGGGEGGERTLKEFTPTQR